MEGHLLHQGVPTVRFARGIGCGKESANGGTMRRLNRYSSNSSKPPSSDPPWQRPAPKSPSGRKPGGQPGHPGHFRVRLQPTSIQSYIPQKNCSACGLSLPPSPHRRSAAHLPSSPRTASTAFGDCRTSKSCTHVPRLWSLHAPAAAGRRQNQRRGTAFGGDFELFGFQRPCLAALCRRHAGRGVQSPAEFGHRRRLRSRTLRRLGATLCPNPESRAGRAHRQPRRNQLALFSRAPLGVVRGHNKAVLYGIRLRVRGARCGSCSQTWTCPAP